MWSKGKLDQRGVISRKMWRTGEATLQSGLLASQSFAGQTLSALLLCEFRDYCSFVIVVPSLPCMAADAEVVQKKRVC